MLRVRPNAPKSAWRRGEHIDRLRGDTLGKREGRGKRRRAEGMGERRDGWQKAKGTEAGSSHL